MHIIVVGCGRVGSNLAYRLFQRGHLVVVIDTAPNAFTKLPHDFKGRMVEGEGLSQDVLHRAGIERAESVAVVTDSDAVNAVIGHIAHSVYHIDYVVIRNNDPAWRPFQEAFGVQIVSSASWGVQRIEELLDPTTIPIVYSAGNGEVDIFECAVPDGWAGSRLREILPAQGVIPVSLTRAGRAELPSPDIVLKSGDLLHLSATLEGIEALRAHLSKKTGA
jgi:trk system potassium uptake protein TrkA